MGRQRQRQRQRQRAKQQARPAPPKGGGPNTTPIVAGIVVILAVVVVLVVLVVRGNAGNGNASGNSPTAVTASTPPKIDGIPCMNEMLTYHVHAHLAINDAGKPVTVPAYIGIKSTSPTSGCLYWLHTHDDSGIIHIEAPHAIRPTLGMFFDVWGQPLSSTRVAGASVKPGQSMRIWVDRKLYTGNPRRIRLHEHELITIDIGPPFPREQGFDFSTL